MRKYILIAILLLLGVALLVGILFYKKQRGVSEGNIELFNETPQLNEKRVCTTTLQYNENTCPVGKGCVLKFSCPSASSASVVNAPLNITAITINAPSLLQATPGDAPQNWYNDQIDCMKEADNMTCSNFLPIASDFTLHGMFANQSIDVHVRVKNEMTAVQDCANALCGQIGTTVQRMFDCSQRVKNFAGIGTGEADNGFNPFVPGRPDPNWFLVSSPNEGSNQCFWLSPVINNNRLLWSGVSKREYNFFQANGNNGRHSNPASYDYYKVISYNTMASYAGPIAESPNNAGFCSVVPGSGKSRQKCQAAYAAVSSAQSVCQLGIDPMIIIDAAYAWQMPTYAMLLTLTGGDEDDLCEKEKSQYGALCSANGFRAISKIPGFDRENLSKESYFWSSSVVSPQSGWLFSGSRGQLSISDLADSHATSVRCVSAKW